MPTLPAQQSRKQPGVGVERVEAARAAAAAAAAVAASQQSQHGGAYEEKEDVKYSPDEFEPMIRHQYAWRQLNDDYNSLTPEHKAILPKPPKEPILNAIEPFQRYIEENSEDPEALTEAREAVDMLPPNELDELMKPSVVTDSAPMSRIKPYYEKALPGIGTPWVPIMVRADVLSRLLKDRSN